MELNQKGILLVISGPSGCGKGTVVAHLLADYERYALSVSLTTRKARHNEIDGFHYYFVSEEEFQENIKNGNFLEYTFYCGHHYGTPKDRVNELLDQGINVILEIETEGALNVKKACPDAVLIMILPPSFRVLEQRLRGRHTNTEEDIHRRLERTKEELLLVPQYDYVVLNPDDGDGDAAKTITAIVETARHEQKRNTNLLRDFYK